MLVKQSRSFLSKAVLQKYFKPSTLLHHLGKLNLLNLFLDPEGSGQMYRVTVTSTLTTARENEVTSSPVHEIFTTFPNKPANIKIGTRPLEITWTKSTSPKVGKYKVRWKAVDEAGAKAEEAIVVGPGCKDGGDQGGDDDDDDDDGGMTVRFIFPMLSIGVAYKVSWRYQQCSFEH